MSVASAGNDHRLGANEALLRLSPVFLGAALSIIVDLITGSSDVRCKAHSWTLAYQHYLQSAGTSTDRNRTKPFAFTGNKFEFHVR